MIMIGVMIMIMIFKMVAMELGAIILNCQSLTIGQIICLHSAFTASETTLRFPEIRG